jgi:diaminopimelate decarboxylase
MAEAVPAGPWPANAAFDEHGLRLAGLPATELAERFGTPLVVIDEGELRARCRRVRETIPRACYAVKAFSAHSVLRVVLDEGLDLLASTGGEVEACLRAGAPPARIVLHGNAKTDEELELAIEAGVGLVIADGPDELRRLDAVARTCGRVQPVLLRVVPEVEVETHEAIATGHDASKFGTSLALGSEVLREAAGMPNLQVDGVHAHVGSQVLEAAPYLQTIDTLLDLAARVRADAGLELGVIDIGGGFGVRYVDESPPPMEALSSAVLARLAEGARTRGLAAPSLVVEPGRWLVANAGITLYRVVDRKTVAAGARQLLAVDGGMSDNVRPALYDAAYTVAVASATPSPSAWRCPRTPVSATCWPSRRRGPIRTRSRAPTTAWDVRRWWPFVTAWRPRGCGARMPQTSTASRSRPPASPTTRTTSMASRCVPPAPRTPAPTCPSGAPSSPRAAPCAPST